MADDIYAEYPGIGANSRDTPITCELIVDHHVTLAKLEDGLRGANGTDVSQMFVKTIELINADFRATTIALAALERQVNGLPPAEDVEHTPSE
ncbi:hypothetical protein ACTXMW_16225 [Brachybacterium paraconglomeratum]|uniref:hypothetical protein n=1 Tax=Brachybacterium paraconglomeratum TaxID=173362 RepID=UPI003FD3C2F2